MLKKHVIIIDKYVIKERNEGKIEAFELKVNKTQ